MVNPLYVPMQIVNIETIDAKEMVYNFAVEEDESYILNGVVSHNCRCALAPYTEELGEPEKVDFSDFDEWLKNQ